MWPAPVLNANGFVFSKSISTAIKPTTPLVTQPASESAHHPFFVDFAKKYVRNMREGQTSSFYVVAFTDPNDDLSFRRLAPTEDEKNLGIRIQDVLVKNDWEYVFTYESALKAHTGYIGNREVMDVIFCGTEQDHEKVCPPSTAK